MDAERSKIRAWLQDRDDALLYDPDPAAAAGPSPSDGLYILDGHTPVPADDLLTWARWFQTANRQVADTSLTPHVRVSTVFLGRDHAVGGGVPLLFESMVFGGPCDGDQERCATWARPNSSTPPWWRACRRPWRTRRRTAALDTPRRAWHAPG